MESDYLKLSEQYASFLVAVGGVSITVLALVLSFGSEVVKGSSNSATDEGASRAFLVAALVVATVSCFIGAQMMAETAAFITHHNSGSPREFPGDRLFLLASANIFIGIILLLFALMLLLTTSGKRVDAASMKPIALLIFVCVVAGACYWMYLAATSRMPAPSGCYPSVTAVIISLLWGIILSFFFISKKYMQWRRFNFITEKLKFKYEKIRNNGFLVVVFMPIIIFTVYLFLYFARTFNNGGKVYDLDIYYFSLAITFSYVSLVVAAIKTVLLTKPATYSTEENSPDRKVF